MAESADSKLRRVLNNIAKINNVEFKDISSLLINHELNEFKTRNNFFGELNSVLLNKPIDMKQIATITKDKGFVVRGSIGLIVQTKMFFDSDKAPELLENLIGDGTNRPNEDKINQFLEYAIDIAFKAKDGKIIKPNAALFTSAILTSVFPKDFVDYRIGRWKWMTDMFDLEQAPQDPKNIGAMIFWAGRAATELVETATFTECFSDVDIEPNWCAAALTYLLNKEPGFKEITEKVASPNGNDNNVSNAINNLPLNQIVYGPPGPDGHPKCPTYGHFKMSHL